MNENQVTPSGKFFEPDEADENIFSVSSELATEIRTETEGFGTINQFMMEAIRKSKRAIQKEFNRQTNPRKRRRFDTQLICENEEENFRFVFEIIIEPESAITHAEIYRAGLPFKPLLNDDELFPHLEASVSELQEDMRKEYEKLFNQNLIKKAEPEMQVIGARRIFFLQSSKYFIQIIGVSYPFVMPRYRSVLDVFFRQIAPNNPNLS